MLQECPFSVGSSWSVLCQTCCDHKSFPTRVVKEGNQTFIRSSFRHSLLLCFVVCVLLSPLASRDESKDILAPGPGWGVPKTLSVLEAAPSAGKPHPRPEIIPSRRRRSRANAGLNNSGAFGLLSWENNEPWCKEPGFLWCSQVSV